MADVFSHQMVGSHSSCFTSEMFRLCIHTFVSHSLNNGTETKESWERLANETNDDDLWKEVQLSLRDSHTHGGQQKDCRTLDELLIGDTDVLKQKIQAFLCENPNTSRLAYLLYTLRLAPDWKDTVLQLHHLPSCLAVAISQASRWPGCSPKTLPRTDGRSETTVLKGKEMAAGKGDN